MSKNHVVLNYYDCVLREADIKLLEGTHWLNDQIISFFFEYLTRDVCPNRHDILFVGPEVVHCLRNANQNELPIFLDPLEARKKDIILLALNNCSLPQGGGGSHWSLLLFIKSRKQMWHLDSIKGSNSYQAQVLGRKLVQYFATAEVHYEEKDCIQQENSYDCGLLVMVFAEAFANSKNYDEALEKCRKFKCNVAVKRTEFLKLIRQMAAN